MMKITSIRLKDVRCFENVNIDLCEQGTPCSALIAGNNGSGKSAILRSIAMGLCDQTSSGALLRELPGDFIRHEDEEDSRVANIEITLKDYEVDEEYSLLTKINTNKKLGFETVDLVITDSKNKKISQEDFEWGKIFVVAFGAGLRTDGTEDYAQYFSADAAYSLFKYSQTLQNPDLVWRRILEVAGKAGHSKQQKELASILSSIMGLTTDSAGSRKKNETIELEHNGIFVRSPSWGRQELTALGDGYRALMTMVLDILGWQLMAQNNATIVSDIAKNISSPWAPLDWSKIEGIVIIDEIEKHLHPKLQRTVIERLATAFPKIQFVISTHSPLCISGAADVEGTAFKILAAHKSESGGRNITARPVPDGYRADQVLVDYFGLTTTVNPKREQKINELRQLVLLRAQGKIKPKEIARLASLSEELERNAPLLYEREEDRKLEIETFERHESLIALLKEVEAKDD